MTTVNTTVLKSVQTDILFQISAPSAIECVNEYHMCANYGRAECKVDKYSGDKATTINGTACDRWSNYYGFRYTHNYCRNPQGREGPYCLTTSYPWWGYCFPMCGMYLDISLQVPLPL